MIASALNSLGGLIHWMGLADRIREAMGARTPTEFARACEVTPAAVTFWLDGSTKSLRAEKAAMMERATGYRAQWIVTGKGPKKVGESGGAAAREWPFSEDLRQRVLTLPGPELSRLEGVMRAHLGMPASTVDQQQQGASGTSAADDESDRSRYAPSQGGSAPKKYAALEDAARYADDSNGSKKNQRATREKGGGRH